MSDPLPLSADEQAARDATNLRSLLGPDVPPGLEAMLGACRPFTGATLALMKQTQNEWLSRVPPAQMENHYFATLGWLFIQSAPENLVRRVVWDLTEFRAAVLEWANADVNGNSRISPEQLAAADAIIAHTLNLVEAADFAVTAKPDEGGTAAPPN
ncbi:MAG: hypothetical protein ABMA13_23575 [Chthoniobacteraceae bacterium]